jgi:hypothetical protein
MEEENTEEFHFDRRGYWTDQQVKCIAKRVGDDEYKKRDSIKEKWEVVDGDLADGTCADITVYFDDGQAMLTDRLNLNMTEYVEFNETHVSLYRQISAALMAYRLMLMFNSIELEKIDDYKQVWELTLQHKITGNIANFYDYKGGCSMGLKQTEVANLDADFKADLEELLTELVSLTIPLNYDGTVAGSVA